MPTLRAIMIFVLAMFLYKGTCGQPGNPHSTKFSVYSKLDYPLYSDRDSITISPNPNVSEEEDYGYPPGRYPVNAECKVNSKTTLHLCRASIENDTLLIQIQEKTASYFYSLKIILVGDSFQTIYEFHYPESEFPRRVFATDQLLVLNRAGFKKGQELHGFINFRGTGQSSPGGFGEWDSKEDYVPSDVVIRGPFRAVIE